MEILKWHLRKLAASPWHLPVYGDVLVVDNVTVVEGFRNQGRGTALYKGLIDAAESMGTKIREVQGLAEGSNLDAINAGEITPREKILTKLGFTEHILELGRLMRALKPVGK